MNELAEFSQAFGSEDCIGIREVSEWPKVSKGENVNAAVCTFDPIDQEWKTQARWDLNDNI